MMIFFTILFSLLVINVVLLAVSVNKLPKLQKKPKAYKAAKAKNLDTVKDASKEKDYEVVFKEAM